MRLLRASRWLSQPSHRSTLLYIDLSSIDTNAALHYYSNENAGTANGVLNISTHPQINSYRAFNETKKQYFVDKKYIQSGMLQSWNKFCFVGGIVEFSAKLPGSPETGGLWPARTFVGPCYHDE